MDSGAGIHITICQPNASPSAAPVAWKRRAATLQGLCVWLMAYLQARHDGKVLFEVRGHDEINDCEAHNLLHLGIHLQHPTGRIDLHTLLLWILKSQYCSKNDKS